MARVRLINKARASKKARKCTKCHEDIEVGQSFYVWSFRYGGDRFRHLTCGHPRPSETTQSLMSTIYAAQEAIQDLGDEASWEDKASAMRDLVSAVEEVAGQYESAAEQFGQSGENQERYEALESWGQELESAADKLDAAAEALAEAEDAMNIAEECPL